MTTSSSQNLELKLKNVMACRAIGGVTMILMESLILAQDERWRRA
jgi:hypothetical protein